MNKPSQHWASQQERGTAFFLMLTRLVVRHFPLIAIQFVTFWVVLYFFTTSRQARKNIAEYQQHLSICYPELAGKLSVFRQFLTFGEAIADRFAVWQKKIRYQDLLVDDADNLYAEMNALGKGQILVCSHLGNMEVCRALLNNGHHKNFKLNVLVHSQHAQAFNQALVEAGADELPLIQVSDLDAAKMLQLSQKIEQGEWIAIAADRVPVRGDKTQAVSFLGENAEFPEGAWLLASLLKVPINTVFALKEKGRYRLKLRKFSAPIQGRGKVRSEKIKILIQHYAHLLEQECRANPYLWFNFYRFWAKKNGE